MSDITIIESNQTPNEKRFSAGSDAIKYFAALAMLIDHIAWCFVETDSVLGYIMHAIGRLTAPIMTYFIVEGFHYTKNLNKYLLRLAIFSALSWFPYVFMDSGSPIPFTFNDGNMYFNPMQGVIYTFFLTVLALKAVHSEKLKKHVKVLIVFGLCVLSSIGDWMFIPIIWALCFDRFRGNFKKQVIAFVASSAVLITGLIFLCGDFGVFSFQYGVLLALIPLYLYNGEKGRGGRFNKWFFYVFYPAHMIILGVLRWYVFA